MRPDILFAGIMVAAILAFGANWYGIQRAKRRGGRLHETGNDRLANGK
jgi:hypothetical protein